MSFSGALNSNGGGGIVVNTNTGGTINFNANGITLNTGVSNAVNLDTNGTATINFQGGGLDVDTTTGIGFRAVGGGTVNVTGSSNSINSVSNTALSVVNTTIGGSGLTFQRIDAGNTTAAAEPVNGIVLNNTGASGGLTVTGNDTNNSGGTIQNTTGHGISLTSTLTRPSVAARRRHADVFDMDGAQLQSASIAGQVGNEWDLEGIADYNSDGTADLLWHRDDGALILFEMADNQLAHAALVGQVGA